jgi:hypothetical protein
LLGELDDLGGRPIVIGGLWDLVFGDGTSGRPANTLFFSAGIDNQNDGLFGTLVAAAAPPTPTPTKKKPTPTPSKKSTSTPLKKPTPTPAKKSTPTATKKPTPTPTRTPIPAPTKMDRIPTPTLTFYYYPY